MFPVCVGFPYCLGCIQKVLLLRLLQSIRHLPLPPDILSSAYRYGLAEFLSQINRKITTLREFLTSLNPTNQPLQPVLITIQSSFDTTETYLNKIITRINESSTTSTSTVSLNNIMEIIALNPANGLRNT